MAEAEINIPLSVATADKVRELLDKQIRPKLKAHQGDIELVEITPERFAKVKLTGACATCPGAQQTLLEVVEADIMKYCPEIQGAILAGTVSDELINQALTILRKPGNRQLQEFKRHMDIT